jgi:hypothetical protein
MLWHRELSSALEDLGPWPVPGVNCVYVNDWLILFFYVDDIVALCTKSNVAKLGEFETQLLKKFEMRALGELKWFLGIRIPRSRSERKIWLCQSSYLCKIAAKFGLVCLQKGLNTPLPFDGMPCGAVSAEIDQQNTYA